MPLFVGGLTNLLKTIMRPRHVVSSKVSYSRGGEKLPDSNSPRFATPIACPRLSRRDRPWKGSKHCKTRDEVVGDLSTQNSR